MLQMVLMNLTQDLITQVDNTEYGIVNTHTLALTTSLILTINSYIIKKGRFYRPFFYIIQA